MNFSTIKELIKLNISFLVLITCYIGYYLGLRSQGFIMVELQSWITFFYLLIGTFLSSSGSSMLNQFIEREHDSKMLRTRNRPLPAKKVKPKTVLFVGAILCFLGPFILYYFINFMTSLVSFLTIISYLFVYTPLKRITSFNTIIGSIPGALPPVGGWAAATGNVELKAMMLFGILFCWQIPHFLSLAIIYKDDYKRGGFKMLPSITDDRSMITFQILFFTMALIYTSVGIYFVNIVSYIYVIGAIILGLIFLFYSSVILFEYSSKTIKRIFIFSIIYLPVLLIMIIIDSIFF